MSKSLAWLLPTVFDGERYSAERFTLDLTAAIVVTALLIPQSLAYAMLAGVPAEVGLYASILPLVGYAIFGSSHTLSVGPVAVISLMTASSIGNVTQISDVDYLTAATTLALLSGLLLLLFGLLRFGFIANFLSHTVISGFISASGVLIALSQTKHLLGVNASGDTLPELLHTIVSGIAGFNGITALLGFFVIIFLVLAKYRAAQFLQLIGLKSSLAKILAKTAPIAGVILSIAIVANFNLAESGVAITGDIPSGLPSLSISLPTMDVIKLLFMPALLISIIGYVESISVGKTLASKRRQKIDANRELVGLGAANIASAASGGIPVTGGFSRSVVNFDAGAATQLASIMAAIGIALAALFLTPLLYFLPKATLAATIVVAVVTLIDIDILKKTWAYSKSDFTAIAITIAVTLLQGVETGVACGILTSIGLHLYRSSKPHIAEVGLIEGSEHFRNVNRYQVITFPHLVTLRPDESLFFANSTYLEDKIAELVYLRDDIAHVVLQCSAINEIDYSALETLEAINIQLREQGIKLHLSEVKGPVMDSLKKTGLLQQLSGDIFISQYQAFCALTK